eukprot:637751-Pelagomonas_calceolata.AAC.1
MCAQVSNKDGHDHSSKCLVKLDKLSRKARAAGFAGGRHSRGPSYAGDVSRKSGRGCFWPGVLEQGLLWTSNMNIGCELRLLCQDWLWTDRDGTSSDKVRVGQGVQMSRG